MSCHRCEQVGRNRTSASRKSAAVTAAGSLVTLCGCLHVEAGVTGLQPRQAPLNTFACVSTLGHLSTRESLLAWASAKLYVQMHKVPQRCAGLYPIGVLVPACAQMGSCSQSCALTWAAGLHDVLK